MRPFPLRFLLALSLAACAAPSPGAEQRASQPPPAQAGTRIADPQAYTRQLFSRFHERIVNVEEHRSGPGYPMLTHISLYERPEADLTAGLCQVRVHEVTVQHVPPPAEPLRHAQSVRTSTRYFAIGPVGPSFPPSDQRQRCASLASARNFFTASRDDARLALEALTDARHLAANIPRAISFTCTSYRLPCQDPARIFMLNLTLDRVRAVERIACADGARDAGNPCFRIGFQPLPDGLGGDWTVTTQGLRRPVRIHLEHTQPPVV